MIVDDDQAKALASLERAFKKCSKAGVSFVGMDDDICMYDAKELEETQSRSSDLHSAQRKCGGGTTVNTHSCYIDSGGW